MSDIEPWAKRILNGLPANRRATVSRFLQHLADLGVTGSSKQNYLCAIRTLPALEKPYEELTLEDMRGWVEKIDSTYAQGTASLHKAHIKRFLAWVHGDERSYPPCVSWIRARRERGGLGREVLSQAEVRSMVDVCGKQRDRALLFVLYDGGLRASELLWLRIRNVEFDDYGAIIRIRGKTGERRVRLLESVPDLQLWLSMHPSSEDSDAPLWPSEDNKGNAIHRRTLEGLVLKYARKAGIKKKVCPHSLRHSRATHLARILKEAQMREFFGWSRSSKMVDTYVHLSGRDVDETLLESHGIRVEEKRERTALVPKVCPKCWDRNPPSANFCTRCGAVLDARTAIGRAEGIVTLETVRQALKKNGLDDQVFSDVVKSLGEVSENDI